MWVNTGLGGENPENSDAISKEKRKPALVVAFSTVERRAANPENEMVTH